MARAIIVIEDGPVEGTLKQSLLYDPPLKDDVPLTPAQAVGGHCFGIVKHEIDKLSKEQVDNVQPEWVDVDDKKLAGIKSAGPLVMGASAPQEQFQTPKIIRDLKGNV